MGERRRMMYSVSKMPVRMVRMMEVGLGTFQYYTLKDLQLDGDTRHH